MVKRLLWCHGQNAGNGHGGIPARKLASWQNITVQMLSKYSLNNFDAVENARFVFRLSSGEGLRSSNKSASYPIKAQLPPRASDYPIDYPLWTTANREEVWWIFMDREFMSGLCHSSAEPRCCEPSKRKNNVLLLQTV